MRQIVTVRKGNNKELLVSIPVGIRAVVSLNAGDKVMMTARGGQIVLTPEKVNGSKKSKRRD